MTVVWVALGASVGAPLRFLIDRWIQVRHDTVFEKTLASALRLAYPKDK